MDINEQMQLEAADGEAYRRELAAKRAMQHGDAVPVSSLPQERYKSPPMREQIEQQIEKIPHEKRAMWRLFARNIDEALR